MQLQGRSGDNPGKYRNIFHTIRVISAEESVLGLWKGIYPGIMRQMTFAPLRFGIYEEIKKELGSTPSLFQKVCAGLFAGGFAIAVTSPTDCLKVRFQAQGKLLPGEKPLYSSLPNAASKIFNEEGYRGFWRGAIANILRNAVVNAAELATYDTVKPFYRRNLHLNEGFALHVVAATTAGFSATVCGSPVDVIKTRFFNQKFENNRGTEYTGVIEAFKKIYAVEGHMGFYKGFVPNFVRIAWWNIVCFATLEKVRKSFGLEAFGAQKKDH